MASISSSAAPTAAGSTAFALPVGGPWGVWACLILAGTLGLWSEKTWIGKELSGALIATLLGMLMANIGILPPGPKEMNVVYKYLLPLAIPMLLFSADLRRVITETGRMLLAFMLGAFATVAGSYAAMYLFPLTPWLGDAGWRIASALTARHIGGAVNYMAVSESLQIPPSVFGAGLAADDLILTLYFAALYTLAKAVPPDSTTAPSTDTQGSIQSSGKQEDTQMSTSPSPPSESSSSSSSSSNQPKKGIQVLEGLTALSISAIICHIATGVAGMLGAPGQSITIITAMTVLLATAMPRELAPLSVSAEGLAQILMQVFYATIGASANIGLVISSAPVLFCFSFIALALHLGILLGLGSLLGFSRRDLLVASNANIGGPSTVAGMAAAKGWTSSIVPGILVSTMGYALGSFLGIGMGHVCFKPA